MVNDVKPGGVFLINCQKEMKRAVECGYWNMFRFNPMLKAEGKNPFTCLLYTSPPMSALQDSASAQALRKPVRPTSRRLSTSSRLSET